MEQSKVNQVITKYIADRDLIAEKTKELKDQVAELQAMQKKREQWLMGKMHELGVDNLGSKGIGKAYIETTSSATAADMGAFRNFVIEEKQWDLADFRVSKMAVKDLLEEGKTLHPSIKFTEFQSLKIRRP